MDHLLLPPQELSGLDRGKGYLGAPELGRNTNYAEEGFVMGDELHRKGREEKKWSELAIISFRGILSAGERGYAFQLSVRGQSGRGRKQETEQKGSWDG